MRAFDASLVGLLVVAHGVALLTGPAYAAGGPEASIVSSTTDGRLVTLEVESPSVGRTGVSLLLPSAWQAEAERRWPVLFLLHGATNDHTTWLEETDVEGLTEDLEALVVMPDGGEYGFYSDWWDEGTGGQPMWETYHLEELPDLLEDAFGAGDVRAVAGNSMGGFGAMSYAARRPGMFQAAASFSGVLDIFSLGRLGEEVWGDREEQRDVWLDHDPVSLAERLEDTALYVTYGDGRPGPLDGPEARFDVVEGWLSAGNVRFVERLRALGLPAAVADYGPGTHTWPYWERALVDALPLLEGALELASQRVTER
jgi:S-formylglutathione hydrolase FrmB